MNYTQIEELYGTEYNLSPRIHAPYLVGSDVTALNEFSGAYFIDIDREAAINIGVDWPYPDLTGNECVITSDLQDEFDFAVGDTVQLF